MLLYEYFRSSAAYRVRIALNLKGLGFDAIEAQLGSRPAGRFCFGDTPTLADVCLVPQVANAGRVKLDMSAWPHIRAINEACLALPAFDRARPENHPDRE